MPRALTSDEAKAVMSKAKPEGSRPFIYDSSSGTLNEISQDFETYLILAPAGMKAQASQFIADILLFDINNLVVRNNLMKRWCQNEMADLDNEIKGYKDILDQYDDLRPQLAQSTLGFEDVPEVNTMLQDFTAMLGDFVEQRDSLQFAKSVASVMNTRETGKLPSALKQEIESYARALLTYE